MLALLKIVANPIIALPMVLLVSWAACLLTAGHRFGWWNASLLGDTLVWFFGVAIILLFNANKALTEEHFFRHVILSALGFVVFFEVFMNLYVFSIWGELVLAALVTMLTLLSLVAGREERFKLVKTVTDSFMALIGFAVAVYVSAQIVRNWRTFNEPNALRELWLPIWLTVGVVPLVYVFTIFMGYESAFRRINLKTDDWRSLWRARLALVLKLHVRTRDLGAFTMTWGKRVAATSSLREALQAMDEFRSSVREDRLAPMRERERLQRFADVEGVDGDGRQLDQREFKETRRALETLASAQMGWYHNRGKRYRKELVEILEPRFESEGLPRDHGVTLHVTEGGESWWGWRRTITGWCFGVGAAGPPPDEWLYDGPEPPSGPPRRGVSGWSQWGADAKNW